MFDELDKQTATSAAVGPAASTPAGAPAPGKVEDILFEVDRTAKPEVFKPQPAGSIYKTVVPADDSWLKNKSLIFGLLGGAFVILLGGFLVLKFFIKTTPAADLAGTAPVNNSQTSSVPVTPDVSNQIEATAVEPISQPEVTQPVDSDLDGLADEEEIQLGTNANNSDTDQDGLTDREEAKVYQTDPLSADTDGDSFSDGSEIQNGYSPKGDGKLMEINNQ